MKRLRAKGWVALALLAVVVFSSLSLLAVKVPLLGNTLLNEKMAKASPGDSGVKPLLHAQPKPEASVQEVSSLPQEEPTATQAQTAAKSSKDEGGSSKSPLPDERALENVAENALLRLKADPGTGHFTVTNKNTGQVWRSFPNPDGWDDKLSTDAWKLHLQSPFMLRYVEFNVRKDLDKESDFLALGGKVTSFERTEDGYRIVYELPELGFVIPVQVRLKDDYVETRIVSDGLVDEKKYTGQEQKKEKDPKARLVSIRLFPFLGAETSDRENGFLLIPDGPGALIDFKKDQPDLINFYNERVYGDDWAYSYNTSFSNRQPVKMPVFGIKSGKQAVLGIIAEGAEYASVFAVPSKSFSQYNWVTAEQNFRFKFFQPTDTRRKEGFFTYSQDLVGGDRATRYYFISGDNPDYVDMAVRYRKYLTDEVGVEPLQGSKAKVPLHLNLLGADTEKGFLWDSFLPLTTSDQAKEIVQKLNSLGVEEMSIAYMGWQKGGYSANGGHFPIPGGLGGNGGMKTFIDYAHSKGFPVYLDARSYSYNNTGRDGFRKSRDGLRDLSSAVIDFTDKAKSVTLVNPRFMSKVIDGDLANAKRLGVDGFLYGDAVGSFINTDYNEKHPMKRNETLQLQEEIMLRTKETLGGIMVSDDNFYSAPYADHLEDVYSDYSYDMFVDRIVPFAQIALHGLVSYSHNYANLSGDYVHNYLKGIEYGAEPSFLITSAPSQDLMKSRSLSMFYSTNYKDWTEEMVSLYQRSNEALEGVQGQFITGHRMLAEGVFETTYSGGRRIIVNYNETPYSGDGISVSANNFAVVGGG